MRRTPATPAPAGGTGASSSKNPLTSPGSTSRLTSRLPSSSPSTATTGGGQQSSPQTASNGSTSGIAAKRSGIRPPGSSPSPATPVPPGNADSPSGLPRAGGTTAPRFRPSPAPSAAAGSSSTSSLSSSQTLLSPGPPAPPSSASSSLSSLNASIVTPSVQSDDLISNHSSIDSDTAASMDSKDGSNSSNGKRRKTNITVCVRVRPMNQIERRSKQFEAWSFKDNNCVFQTFVPQDTQSVAFVKSGGADLKKTPAKPLSFNFDEVFTEDKNNQYVYERIGENVVENAMSGYHGCVFAYGQTSSGKTYTIHGTKDDPGMIPLSVQGIFSFIERTPEREFVLRVSYLEIYNEIINDLLDPRNTNLRVREDKSRGIFVESLKEDVVMSAEQVFALLSSGESHRHIGRTNYNEVSSRSHTIFRIVIESSPRATTPSSSSAPVTGVRQSILNLVDLAGSENALKAGSDARIAETGYINRSLLTLGHVIYKLTEHNTAHVPYRDSKLTRILQSSLDGKACVSVCCNMSPSSGNLDETISTLKFASRAKKIRNSAKVNEVFDESTLLRQYREEIVKLKRELAAAREANMRLAKIPASESNDGSSDTHSLNAQIENYQRMILHAPDSNTAAASSSSDHHDTNDGDGDDDEKPPAPAPPHRTSRSGSISIAPNPYTKGNYHASSSTDASSQLSPTSSAAIAAAALHVSALSLDGETPADTTKRLHSELTDAMRRLFDTERQLREQTAACDEHKRHREMLQTEVDNQNKTLDEWDKYYVVMRNKYSSLEQRNKDLDRAYKDMAARLATIENGLSIATAAAAGANSAAAAAASSSATTTTTNVSAVGLPSFETELKQRSSSSSSTTSSSAATSISSMATPPTPKRESPVTVGGSGTVDRNQSSSPTPITATSLNGRTASGDKRVTLPTAAPSSSSASSSTTSGSSSSTSTGSTGSSHQRTKSTSGRAGDYLRRSTPATPATPSSSSTTGATPTAAASRRAPSTATTTATTATTAPTSSPTNASGNGNSVRFTGIPSSTSSTSDTKQTIPRRVANGSLTRPLNIAANTPAPSSTTATTNTAAAKVEWTTPSASTIAAEKDAARAEKLARDREKRQNERSRTDLDELFETLPVDDGDNFDSPLVDFDTPATPATGSRFISAPSPLAAPSTIATNHGGSNGSSSSRSRIATSAAANQASRLPISARARSASRPRTATSSPAPTTNNDDHTTNNVNEQF